MKNGKYKKLVEALEECNIDASLKREVLHTLDDLQNKKRYGLVWNREKVAEDVVLNCRKRMPILESVKEKRIMKEGNSEHNIFIEGDNYHALQVLQQTHQGKIDVIYIDPPYNTGNKDFIYNDKYVDSEDDYRHSKWLSFMEKRLELAKKLLSDTGVIFISIDDNEQANLKLLCDEIFGEENFITNIIWQSSTGASDAKTIDTTTEYILVYVKLPKEKDLFARNEYAFKKERYRLKDEYEKERGPYYTDNLDRGGLRYSDKLNYPITCPDGTNTFPNGRTEFYNDGWTWKWGEEKVKWGIENNYIAFKKSKTKKSGWSVYYKNYLYADNEGNQIERSAPQKNLITDIKTGEGAASIKDIFGHQLFKYSKPVDLIKRIIGYVNKRNDMVILDFFAGSGTTGHAVLELNKEDGGNRQFILCTNNENNNGNGHIAEKVCYPRIKKVIEGYKKNGDGDAVAGLGGGLEYFKTDFVNVNMNAPTDQDRSVVSRKVGYIIGMRHNCFDEVVSESHYQIFANKENKIFIYFEQDLRKFREFQEYMRGETGIMYSYAGESRAQYGIEEEDFQGIEVRKIPDRFFSVYKNCID